MSSNTPVVQQAAALLATMDTAELRRTRNLANQALSKVCHILELPEELRLQICEYVLVDQMNVWSKVRHKYCRRVLTDKDHYQQPALLRTCRQIRAEASSIFYDKNVFNIDCRGLDPSAAISFTQHALVGSSKPHQIKAALYLGNDTNWDNVKKWLHAYYDKKAVFRVRANAPGSETAIDDYGRDEFAFVGHLFNMLEKLQKSGMAWPVIEDVLEEAWTGTLYLTPW